MFVHFLKIGGDVPGWPIAMLLGIVLWNFFSEITNNGVGAIVGRGDLIRKINFPKYIIVIASSISALINLVFNLVVLMIFLFIADIDLGWSALLTPLYIIELFVFGLGIAFILSTLYVRFRDINYIWEIIMQALFYGSAIIYPLSIIATPNPVLAQLILLSPITQSIQGARAALVDPANLTAASMNSYWWVIFAPFVITIITFVLGAFLFKKSSPHFAENV